MNTVARLDSIVRALLDQLHNHPFGKRLCAGNVTREEYVAFLVQTYHYVLHTRPLLARAGERLVHQGKTQLGQLFLHKAEEESGHEHWIVEDLRAIGENPDIVQKVKPVPAVQTFVTWNSFVVEHGSPVALLGAAYVLEAVSSTHAGIVTQNLMKESRIRGIEHGVRFLRGHADADIEHIVALGQAIEAIATAAEDREDIVTTARITQSTYAALYTALEERPAAKRSPEEFTFATGTAQSASRACRLPAY